jgi:thioredoxin 1
MILRLLLVVVAFAAVSGAVALWRRPSRKLAHAHLDLEGWGVEGPAILQFTATWCAPCKAAKPHLEEAAREAEVGYSQVDVETYPEVGSLYGIRSVPTIVVTDAHGHVMGHWTSLPANGEIRHTAEKARLVSASA